MRRRVGVLALLIAGTFVAGACDYTTGPKPRGDGCTVIRDTTLRDTSARGDTVGIRVTVTFCSGRR